MKSRRKPRPRVKRMYWIAAYTKSSKELFVKDQVEAQGFEAHAPEYFDEYHQKVKIMFPGFIFVKTNGPWSFLVYTKGIYKVIMTGEVPSKMSLKQMRDLRKYENKQGITVIPERHTFEAGDEVQLVEGPFKSFVGTYVQHLPKRLCKVRVLFWGKLVDVQIHRGYLEPVTKDSEP